MKKLMIISSAFIISIMAFLSVVEASNSKILPTQLYEIGAKYEVTKSNKIRMERYLTQYPLSDADCDRILAKAKEAESTLNAEGTTDYRHASKATQKKIKRLAEEAAEIAGVTVIYKNNYIHVYKNGVLIDIIGSNDEMLIYTGADYSNVLYIALIFTVVALAVVGLRVITKKKALATNV